MQIKTKLSKPSKMPCLSYALQAGEPKDGGTCQGMYNFDGTVQDVCKECYALKGSYVWPVVKKVRTDNLIASKQSGFIAEMVELLNKQKHRHFRWFDSGDVPDDNFLYKLYTICRQTENIKHWIPTKSRELYSQRTWEQLEALPNVRVRYSSPSITGAFEAKHGSTVVPDKYYFNNDNPHQVFNCLAPDQGGKCLSCRACWSKHVEVIAYVKH